MEYERLDDTMKAGIIRQSLEQLETQHYMRMLDAKKWQRIVDWGAGDIPYADEGMRGGWIANARHELALARYDIRRLELAIEETKAELASLAAEAIGGGKANGPA